MNTKSTALKRAARDTAAQIQRKDFKKTTLLLVKEEREALELFVETMKQIGVLSFRTSDLSEWLEGLSQKKDIQFEIPERFKSPRRLGRILCNSMNARDLGIIHQTYDSGSVLHYLEMPEHLKKAS